MYSAYGLNDWIVLVFGAIGVPLVLFVINLFLPNGKVEKGFFIAGKVATVFLRQKIGKNWEPVEKRLQGTLSAAISGLYRGLDFDDKE